MPGFIDMRTAGDLLAKLAHDLGAMRADPLDTYKAFDFFLTAEHMGDWIKRGPDGDSQGLTLKKDVLSLRICSHVANGAKHFEVDNPKHDTVAGTARESTGYFAPTYFAPSYFSPDYFANRERLVIRLEGDALTAEGYGESISALVLAEQVYRFWHDRLNPLPSGVGDSAK